MLRPHPAAPRRVCDVALDPGVDRGRRRAAHVEVPAAPVHVRRQADRRAARLVDRAPLVHEGVQHARPVERALRGARRAGGRPAPLDERRDLRGGPRRRRPAPADVPRRRDHGGRRLQRRRARSSQADGRAPPLRRAPPPRVAVARRARHRRGRSRRSGPASATTSSTISRSSPRAGASARGFSRCRSSRDRWLRPSEMWRTWTHASSGGTTAGCGAMPHSSRSIAGLPRSSCKC